MYARLFKTSIFILSVLVSSCNRQEEKMVAKSDSIAYQLATINAGQPISPSDPNIEKFENLIAALSSKYVEDKERIANITVKSHGMLKKEGISTSLLEIMDGMNQLVSERDTINKYPEFMAIYHTSRIAGDSHEDTILNIKALLRSLGVR